VYIDKNGNPAHSPLSPYTYFDAYKGANILAKVIISATKVVFIEDLRVYATPIAPNHDYVDKGDKDTLTSANNYTDNNKTPIYTLTYNVTVTAGAGELGLADNTAISQALVDNYRNAPLGSLAFVKTPSREYIGFSNGAGWVYVWSCWAFKKINANTWAPTGSPKGTW
jgi:hypothetical protein